MGIPLLFGQPVSLSLLNSGAELLMCPAGLRGLNRLGCLTPVSSPFWRRVKSIGLGPRPPCVLFGFQGRGLSQMY